MGILYKKKEINDKTPKLRTEDEKKKLKNLSYKISKIPKNLIDNIITKFPSLQRETRLNKQKEYDHEKRSAESDIEKERRQSKDKEYHSQKRSTESEIEKEMRLNKQKEYDHEKC